MEIVGYVFEVPMFKNDIGGFFYIMISSLPEEEREIFSNWMYGQTMPYIEEVPDAVFAWDYARWKKGLPMVD